MNDYLTEEMTERDCEIYVRGMWDLMMMIGCDGHCKHYDPLYFEGAIAHSYVLELADGGRHHEYLTPEWVALRALLELASAVRADYEVGDNDYFRGNIERRIKEIEDHYKKDKAKKQKDKK
jgi:hypothetical protein